MGDRDAGCETLGASVGLVNHKNNVIQTGNGRELLREIPLLIHTLTVEECWSLAEELKDHGLLVRPSYLDNHSKSTKGGEPTPVAESTPAAEPITTMAVRNLPATNFSQKKVYEWVDASGFANMYDFLLWFPSKSATPTGGYSYAFINFVEPSIAQRFQLRFHNNRCEKLGTVEAERHVLNIVTARVQGFAKNYMKFRHLLDQNWTGLTCCSPYFSSAACAGVPALLNEEKTYLPRKAAPTPEENVTTLVIRNLPLSVKNQETARQLMDKHFKGTYDFFLYIPSKTRRASVPYTYPYAFVNFHTAKEAKDFIEKVNKKFLKKDDPSFNIAPARVQGLTNCVEHFQSMSSSARCKPWFEFNKTESAPFIRFQ